MDLLFPYSESKLKPYLKMAVQRLQIAKNKKASSSKHQKREIGQLLSKQKEELARIKTEHIIREDFTIEAYEMLELLCELVAERIRLITNCDGKEPPADMKEALASLIWASNQVNIEELTEVKNQLRKKFGSKFVEESLNQTNELVNVRLTAKLSPLPPSKSLVLSYLNEIAKEFKIDWETAETEIPDMHEAFSTLTGFSVPMAPGTNLRGVYQRNVEPQQESINASNAATTTSASPSGTLSPPAAPQSGLSPVLQQQVPQQQAPQPQQLPSPPPFQQQYQPPAAATATASAPVIPPRSMTNLPDDQLPQSAEIYSSRADPIKDDDDISSIPMVTAVVIPPPAPTSLPVSFAPSAAAAASSYDNSLDDNFEALQARLAALRDL